MAGIQTDFGLNDQFSSILDGIIHSVNLAIAAMYDMREGMNADIDISGLEAARQEINQVSAAIYEMNEAMNRQPAPSPAPPVEWQSDDFDVFLSTGVDRYEQELSSLTSALDEISALQSRIITQAGESEILPPQASDDMLGMENRLTELQSMIQQIENTSLDVGTDEANAQLESLRAQMLQLHNHQQNLEQAMQGTDVSAINDAYLALSRTISSTEQSVRAVRDSFREPDEPPVQWQSDGVEVFTGSGIERFQQEAQSANAMLQQLSSTQAAIARQAYNNNIFPAEAFRNLNTMTVRIDNIRERIQQMESNPLNMGSDTANAELEQLRTQLNQALQVQEVMNHAVNEMDVRAANDAYLRLSQIIGGTERHIRDNVDEQGRFRREIEKSTDSTADLKNMVAGLFGALDGIVEPEKVREWIEGCMAAFNTQLNAETQLISVLANTLDEEYADQFEVGIAADTTAAADEISFLQDMAGEITVPVTVETRALTTAYDQITAKAGEVQGRGVFGDEVMIAAAAELSAYFSDPEAVVAMMDTLSDYAMGMNILDGKGLAVDSDSMVAYAANLGKIMTGTYTAMSENGFVFTDAQKAVIEGAATEAQIVEALGEEYLGMSADMQAAAAIDSVIGKAWSGLYETMSNTPEGKIKQMLNTWGDMKEVVGGQLYPYVILFVDAITSHWGVIQAVLDGITLGLQVMMGVLSWLLEGALDFGQAVIDNWGQIGPVIGTVSGAVIILAAAFAAYQLVMSAASVVQTLFNTTLLGCPLVWILAIIMAVIVAVYKIVEAVNNATGATYSALGVIMGMLAFLGAFLWNLAAGAVDLVFGVIEYLVNPFINFANFIANLFVDPIGSVIRLFGDMADTVLTLLQKVASAVDFVFGGNLADTIQGWRDDLSDKINEAAEKYGNGQYEEVVSRLDLSAEGMGISRIDYGAAWEAGYSFGEGIDESIANFDPSLLFGVDDIPSAEDYADIFAAGGFGRGFDDIAEDTGSIKDSLNCTEENLKFLRDIAEQETVNRYTLAEVKIEQTNNNNINSGMDLDGIVSGLTEAVTEAVDSITEGVHK